MPGIISRNMVPAEAETPASMMPADEQESPAEGKEKPGGFLSGVEKSVPPELMESFERVVLAGKKIMYSPQMEDTIKEELAGDGPIEKKLAFAVAGLVSILDKQAKPKLPVKIIVPAAIELLYDAANFISEAGLAPEVTPEQLKTATQGMVMLVLKMYGSNDEQIKQAMSGKMQEPDAAAPEPAQPPVAAGDANGL